MREHFEIFISYRHKENRHLANKLYDIFTNQYDIKTFRDEEELHFGDFRSQLISNNKNSEYLLLLLTPDTLTRCSEENDWITKEINLFVENKKPIIPVCLAGFNFETATIPQCVSGLLQYKNNAIICNNDMTTAPQMISFNVFKFVRKNWTEKQISEVKYFRTYLNAEGESTKSWYYDSVIALRQTLMLVILYVGCIFLFTSLYKANDQLAYILSGFLGSFITVLGFSKTRLDKVPYLTILLDKPILEFLRKFLFAFFLTSFPIVIVGMILPFAGAILAMLIYSSKSYDTIQIYFTNIFVTLTLLPLARNVIKSIHYTIDILVSKFAPYPKKYFIYTRRKKIYKIMKILGWVLLLPAIIACGFVSAMLLEVIINA